MADPGTPEWWRDRLYAALRKRQPTIKAWDDWYSGDHPAPAGNEKAQDLLVRLLDTVGLNILGKVTDAAHERMQVSTFKVNGEPNADIMAIWNGNRFAARSRTLFQEMMGLSEALVLVDPNLNQAGVPTMTVEHPEQAIVEDVHTPGESERRIGLKSFIDDTQGDPLRYVYLNDDDEIRVWAAPSRGSGWAQRPGWEYQESLSGDNELGECSLVPFRNRARLLRDPRPEWWPALGTQRRINKTLLDRMAMQDEGSFKAMWATGLQIPTDPETGRPVEPVKRALDRLFVNEDPDGKWGQFEAEDIKQLLEAVKDDVTWAAVLVPTPPDQLLGEIVNVSEGGLEAARDSLTRRVNLHKDTVGESLEIVARLALKAAGKDVPDVAALSTGWESTENATEGAKADAAVKWSTLGVPDEALWERFLGASPEEIGKWSEARDAQATREAGIAVKAVRDAANGGN